MSHPIDFFYRQAGYVLRPYMTTVPADAKDRCAVCDRSTESWVSSAEKVIFNNYGQQEVHCLACHSLYEGSIELFGIERMASGTPVPMKLGMATGCGALVTPSGTRLFLNGFIKKMSAAEKPPFPMVELSGRAAHKEVILNTPDVPYLYIGNFGRKKKDLVSNLALSTGETLAICEENSRSTLPLVQVRTMVKETEDLSQSQLNQIKSDLRSLYTGIRSPQDAEMAARFQALAQERPALWTAITELPDDPHQCLTALQFI